MSNLNEKDALVLTADGTPLSRDILEKIRAIPPERLLVVADRNHTLYGTGKAPAYIPPLLSEIYRVTNGGLVILTSTEVDRTDQVFGGSVCAVIGDYGKARRLCVGQEIDYIAPSGEILEPDLFMGGRLPPRKGQPDFLEDQETPAYTKLKALQQALDYYRPWQRRIMIGLGDDPRMDGDYLRFITESGGYSFSVSSEIPGTLATLIDTDAAIVFLNAAFHGKIAELELPIVKTPPERQEARKQFLSKSRYESLWGP